MRMRMRTIVGLVGLCLGLASSSSSGWWEALRGLYSYFCFDEGVGATGRVPECVDGLEQVDPKRRYTRQFHNISSVPRSSSRTGRSRQGDNTENIIREIRSNESGRWRCLYGRIPCLSITVCRDAFSSDKELSPVDPNTGVE